MAKLDTPSKEEIEFSKQLRQAVREKISKKGWKEGFVAEKLEILPSGLTNLLDRDLWSIETAVRVASALEIDICSECLEKNKTSSAVRCTHKPSGGVGRAEDSRSQLGNKKLAFRRMAESKEFQKWVQIECARVLGWIDELEKKLIKKLKQMF